jgi:hypothetical protein
MMRMMRVMVFLGFVFEKVLCQAAQYATANRAQEAVPLLLPEQVASNATADGTQKATLAFAHGWCVGVVVGRIRVAGLWRKLMLL